MKKMRNDIKEILFTTEQIEEKAAQLAKELEVDYAGKKPILLGLLKGSIPFIVEDIVDTGFTLTKVIALLKHRGAASVEVVTMLDKPEGRVVEMEPKYIGFTIPKAFVVGYGLDYDEYYRNLRGSLHEIRKGCYNAAN